MNRTLLWLVMPCLFMTGCGDSKIEDFRQQFVLDKEPETPIVVSRLRTALQVEDAPAEIDVVVRGRVYAGSDSSPWVEGKARFILADFSGHDGKSEHNPFDCPYCSESIEDYRVFVTFRHPAGEVIAVDARKLFDLKEMQRVTVKGTATIDGDDVYLSGTGIFVEN